MAPVEALDTLNELVVRRQKVPVTCAAKHSAKTDCRLLLGSIISSSAAEASGQTSGDSNAVGSNKYRVRLYHHASEMRLIETPQENPLQKFSL
jgi:hypothetical protein